MTPAIVEHLQRALLPDVEAAARIFVTLPEEIRRHLGAGDIPARRATYLPFAHVMLARARALAPSSPALRRNLDALIVVLEAMLPAIERLETPDVLDLVSDSTAFAWDRPGGGWLVWGCGTKNVSPGARAL
jgi:hypothetical protein